MGEYEIFEEKKSLFKTKITKMEKNLGQRIKYFDDVKMELSKCTNKFEM